MKKTVAVFLSLVFVLGACSPALADKFDLSALRSNEYLDIDVDVEKEIALVESNFSVKDRSFSHPNESSTQYSFTKFDMLIIDYFGTDPYPIWRLWLTLSTQNQFYYITSVTFTIDNKEYTFSGVSDKDWFYTEENSCRQELLIKFGKENLDFLRAMQTLVKKIYGNMDSLEEVFSTIKIPIVFHGTKDIEAELDIDFLMEFMIFMYGFINCNGFDYIDYSNGTEMKMK